MYPEPILYRTRTVILTERRILLDGAMYPLERVAAAGTRRSRSYLVVLALRVLLTLAAGTALALLVRELAAGTLAPHELAALLGLALADGGLAWLLRRAPVHVVWLRVDADRVNVVRSYDRRHARQIAETINTARARLAA